MRSPIYGLTHRDTGKPTRIACSDFSQAINTLNKHHQEEPAVFDAAMAGLVDAGVASAGGVAAPLLDVGERVAARADRLRDARGRLLDRLLALREPLVDVALEAQALLPAEAALAVDVEANQTEAPALIIEGIDATPQERLTLVTRTYDWSLRVGRGVAARALGPCYLLSYVIEYPTPQAGWLRAELTDVRGMLAAFLATSDV